MKPFSNVLGPTPCEICGASVTNYEPTFCCSGHECACQGRPTEPCMCSKECENALYRGIGKPMNERRLDANILPHGFTTDFHEYLKLSGFIEADVSKDLGDRLVGTSYFVRKVGNIHQYVLLSFYRDVFCEGVYWVFTAPRNERLKSNNTFDAMKRGGVPVSVSLFRDLPSMVNLFLSDDNLSAFVEISLRNLERQCKKQ